MAPGNQAVQASHSLIQFVFEYPETSSVWVKNPYLVQLSVENEEKLYNLIRKLKKSNLKYSVFREPDLNNQVTAIAIEPSDKTRKLVSNLPLMLKEYRKEICYV